MRDDFRLAGPLRTDRLTLRLLEPGDVPAMLAYRSRADVCRYLPFEPQDSATIARQVADRWQNTRLEQDGDAVTLGVVRQDTGDLIGDVVLFVHNRADQAAEIGWVLDPGQCGHGFATEAALALLHVAFDDLGLHRVIAQMHPDNDRSARVCGRLGMRREAHLKRDALVKGRWEDTLLFALLDDEWRPAGAMPTR